MLSYRHAFHAGNHADVLKHLCLKLVLDYFNQKNKPYWYIDTHAGAGLYDLTAPYAQKTGEYMDGIARLQKIALKSAELEHFVRFITQFQKETLLYPGSPMIAKYLLRNSDTLKLFELHPTDAMLLQNNFAASTQCHITVQDGFKGLISILPPLTKRAVILIDPPYEQKGDYSTVISTLHAALKRFQTGCYLLWYPQLSRKEATLFPEQLKQNFTSRYLHVQLQVTAPPASETTGMYGSGMFIINPPYLLHEQLSTLLPELTGHLAKDEQAHFFLENVQP